MAFADSAFAQFMVTSAGRAIRVVAGVALIIWGYTQTGTTAGTVLMIIGLVPLIAGAFDLCLLGPLLGGPVRGVDVRRRTK
jgi:hypothetical protein